MNKTKITEKQKKKKERKRKTIRFNPPFSLNFKTNVGKLFFKILRKSFLETNPLSKIFNQNTVKVSYSYTRDMKSIISGHNKKVLHSKPKTKGSNCRDKNTCPLDSKCLAPKVTYQADVTNDTDDTYKYYLRHAETSFKDRYDNHKSSFRNEQQKISSELSKYVWSLINENKTPTISWKMLKIIYSKEKTDFCKLCLMKKVYILNALGDERCLNKKSEFISKCRHQNKLLKEHKG